MTRLHGWFSLPMLVSFAILGTLPLWIEAVGLYQYLGLEILIWIIFAMGFNLLLGYTGLPSFGHGAFLGIGALTALFLSHRKGIYFALMSIAFGQIYFFIASQWTSVTKGEDGLLNIARLPVELGVARLDISDIPHLYYLCFAAYVVCVVLLWRLVNSPYGKVLRAIKQNDQRVAFLGYNVVLYKWSVFTLSCAVAGLAGGLFAMAQQGAYVQIMSLQWSGIVVLMTLMGGGFVSFWGPLLGVVLYFCARDILGAYTEAWALWFGLMFMVLVMFKPTGLAGICQDLGALLFRGQPRASAPAR